MSDPIRVTVVMTHPVQYYAPWFRDIAARCPELELAVLYATTPTPGQQGKGFGVDFTWDVPLTEGYRCQILRAPRPSDSVASDRFWGVDAPGIGAAMRASTPDIVLIAGWHSIALVRALWWCRRMGIPVVYRGDTHLGSAPSGRRRALWAARTWLLLRCFDAYLSVGRRAREYLQHFGVPDGKIFSAPHCVDNDFFAAAARPHQRPAARAAARAALGLSVLDFVVLFVGKLERNKRPLDVIRAMARLPRGASLLVVGAGELEAECREEAKRLGVEVAWAGFLNQSELGHAYAAADCLALPSRETWGLVVNEALATGLPCVVSDRAGCAPDLVEPGVTGEMFPFGDVTALAAAIARVQARGANGHDWAPACRERAALHGHDRAAAGLLAAGRAVTAGRRRARAASSRAPRVLACCGSMVVVSGLERATFEVLRRLRAGGAAVHCVVNSWEHHRIVPLADRIGASWSTGRYQHRLSRRARSPLALARVAWDILLTSAGLVRDAWRFRPSHVLIPEFGGVIRNGPALAWLRLAGVKIVLHVHNAPTPGVFYSRLWRGVIGPLVDRVVACSEHTHAELLARGISGAKVVTIHNFLPSDRGACENGAVRDPRKIIYVGQVIPAKGVDLLLDAVGQLARRGLEVRLAIVGSMDGWEAPAHAGYRQGLLARAAAPDLSGRVQFLGWRDDVMALMAGAGVHASPSRPEMHEGMPLTCLEAKEAGLPSVVFPVGPFVELVQHGVDGWICREVSVEALAEGLEFFVSDPDRAARAGRAAWLSGARFSAEEAGAAWWRLLARD